jgi:hypothetical protein
VDTREANPGDLGGPVIGGLELRSIDSLQGHFKDVDDKTHQVLVEFPHDTVDSYKTMFGDRAFAESFEQRLPTMCWQHDLRDPIGRALTAQVTPKVNEIRGKFSDPDAVPNAKRAFSQIQDGTITDFSFGFKNAKFQPTGTRGVSRITSAFMAEFSPVTIGSIPGAKAVGLREQGLIIMEMAEILQLRDSGLVTFDGFRALVEEHHPELLEKIVLTDPGVRTASAGDGAAAPEGADEDDTAPVEWTALDSGTHTATGPNGEAMRVKPVKDGDTVTGHSWSVTDDEGEPVGNGTTESDSPASAKSAAAKAVHSKGQRSEPFEFELPDDPDDIDADYVRSVIEQAHPALGLILREAAIAIAPHVATGTDTGGNDNSVAASLAAATDAALDSAVEYLRDVDIAALPDDVQQSLALVQAASVSVDALLDAMGVDDPDDPDEGEDGNRGDTTFSDKPWSDFSQADYTPEQWKEAALIKGEGDNKDAHHLPVKEPDGTYNTHAIAAASSRINQVDAPDEAKTAAAKKLMSLHGKMKKPVPPNVLKVAGAGNREEELAAERDAALAKLDTRLNRRQSPAA